MAVLRVHLAIPDALKPKAAYAFGELCHRVGFGLRLVEDENAHIHYTVDPVSAGANAIVIICNPRLYSPDTICKLHVREQAQIWEEVSATNELDIIGGAYRLLTLQDEWQVPSPARDGRGTFLTTALPTARRALVGAPLIEFHAEALSHALARCWPQALEAATPRWPNGKQYAVMMTHDTDHVHVGAPGELATNFAKIFLRRSATHAALFGLGLRYLLRPRENPFFRFEWWQEWEKRLGLRSAFYLFVRPHYVHADLNDCKSTVAGTSDWQQFCRMAESGWEFGLHASIHTRKYPWAFRAAREWLEARLGRRVVGIRHHYFALDWVRPFESHRAHADAGFKYDSSMAFREVPGFRTGTCLPHRGFDPIRNEEIPIMLLPCNLMDGHLLYKDTMGTREQREIATKKGKDVTEAIRKHGGALMFDWHQETAFNQLIFEGFLEVLDDVLRPCLNENAWIATPEEVSAHWDQRSRELDEGNDLSVIPSTHTVSGGTAVTALQ